VHQLRAGSAPPAEAPATPAPAPGDVLAEAAPADGGDAKTTCERLLQKGKFGDLKAVCTRAFEAAPDAGLAVQVARNALERERYTDAQSWARRAIQLDSHHGEAFLTLGGAEQGLGHNTLARNAYTRYLELEPNGAYADDVRALIEQL
jgi:Flp pilus assembly protein TadD